METVYKLGKYSDSSGNRILYAGSLEKSVKVVFKGSNNTLQVHKDASFDFLDVDFTGSNGRIELGENGGVTPLKASMIVGSESAIVIGNNVSNSMHSTIVATEGSRVVIGNDVMLSSEAHISTGDEFPVFDIETGLRINPSRSIRIGNHVWLARRSTVRGGANIGDGSVVGFGSVVDCVIPNNCIAAGFPARVVRTDVAWERVHLSLRKPFYKPDASEIQKSSYWSLTELDDERKSIAGFDVEDLANVSLYPDI